jgi:hypothetical protein
MKTRGLPDFRRKPRRHNDGKRATTAHNPELEGHTDAAYHEIRPIDLH